MTRIQSLADLRPGDIMFGPIGGAVGVGVGLGQMILGEGWSVGPLKIRHVGIVVEASQQLPPGTIRHRSSGEYYAPNPGRYIKWEGKPNGDYDTYETGAITAPKLVQAMPGGAEEIEMRQDTHWTPRHAYVRLPEDYRGQAADAAAIACLMVRHGVAYSFASYAALAAWKLGLSTPRLEKWIGRRQDAIHPIPTHQPILAVRNEPIEVRLPVEAICSVLVDQAWTLAGKKIMHNVPHQCVTPGALATRLLTSTEGASWAFPGRISPVL